MELSSLNFNELVLLLLLLLLYQRKKKFKAVSNIVRVCLKAIILLIKEECTYKNYSNDNYGPLLLTATFYLPSFVT